MGSPGRPPVEADETATLVEPAARPAAVRRSPADSAFVSRRGTTASTTYHEVLRSSELRHTQKFARITVVLGVFVSAFLWTLGGDALAQEIAYGGILLGQLGLAGLHWLAGDEARYRQGPVTAAYLACVVGVFAVIAFFGMFSAATTVAAMGLFFVGVSRSLRLAVICYVCAALIQGGVSAAIIAGWITDHGLIRAADLSLYEQVVTQVILQMVYLVAVLAGRIVRSQLDQAVEHHDRALRAVARREALLEEARLELEQALRIGGPGRFTEQTLGSFTLGMLIGRGAMGEVYEAVHTETGAPAAVKVLGIAQLGDPSHLTRFHREAVAASTLRSPHTVGIVEVGDASSPIPYLAMERLHGHDLGYYLRKSGAFDRGWLLELARHTADGLDAARQAGIVHRDIKPQNLFRARNDAGSGAVWKILDFGASKLGDHHGSLTRGAVLGTPVYMAPEQARAKEVDHRADVYGLGAVLYRVLTGQPPFSGDDLPSILHEVVYTAPERPSAVAGLPKDVDRVLAIAMAKRPSDRFDRAAELAAALEQALSAALPRALRSRGDALLARDRWPETTHVRSDAKRE